MAIILQSQHRGSETKSRNRSGLYHIITRGNNRQLIFGSDDDYLKMLLLLAQQKAKLPFYLYAYCLMPNHIHCWSNADKTQLAE